MKKNLKILFVSAEVAPYAKTGGLADVAGSLPTKLNEMGHDVRLVMPRYKEISHPMDYCTDFPVKADNRLETCIVRKTTQNNTITYFIDNYHYYNRKGIYCHHDDGKRFAFLCLAALKLLKEIDFKPDIIHCNDWHVGPICMLLKEKYADDDFYKDIKTVFTIHNLEYQGHFKKDLIEFFGVSEEVFTPEKVEFYGSFNFMKAGLTYSDKINTVSSKYAKEILTPKYGERLDGVLVDRENDLYGIVNGISYSDFNPETDIHIEKNYSASKYKDKYINKHYLQKEMGLPKKDVPLIGVVHRLASQKGLELVTETFSRIMSQDVQFVLLGEGDPYYEKQFKKFMKKYPEQVSVRIEFNAALAQRIYAGSDIFLMPSVFEPCGLGQLISLRYGTIPVVRATGGLAETIIDIDKDNKYGNGFCFEEYTPEAFLETLNRALTMYRKHPANWEQLVIRALRSDFSWDRPAKKYLEIYQAAMGI